MTPLKTTFLRHNIVKYIFPVTISFVVMFTILWLAMLTEGMSRHIMRTDFPQITNATAAPLDTIHLENCHTCHAK